MNKYRKFLRFFIRDKGVPNSKCYQHLVIKGLGRVDFGKNLIFGWKQSPSFYSSYGYIDARFEKSHIIIGDNCVFSNDMALISECEGQAGITIGAGCRFGARFRCYDSDFHGLKIADRNNRSAIICKPIRIGENCFIGENVMILKGVELGAGCVVGAGSVVTKSFPANSIIAGNPACFIRKIEN